MSTAFEMEVAFEQETLFCENVFTFTYRAPVLDVRFPKVSGRATDRSRQNRMSKSRPGHLMPRSGGTFEIDFYLPGAMQDTSTGALPATNWAYLLLVAALGGGNASGLGGVAGASATATSLPNATGTNPRGHIIRVGQQLDGKANGQATVLGATPTTLLAGLPAAPGATDKLRASLMSYLDTDQQPPSFRFLVGFREENMQYVASGCVPVAPGIRITDGDVTVVTIPFMYGYWEEHPTTIPSAMTLEDCDPAIFAGGSYFLQTVGTATRPADEAFTSLAIQINTTLVPVTGQAGRKGRLQHMIGFRRSKSSPEDPIATVTVQYPWGTSRPTEYDSDGSDSIFKQLLITNSAGGGTAESEGRHWAMYLPKLFYMGDRPADTNLNQLNYQTAMFGATDGPDETNALTSSALRIGQN